MDSYCGFKAIFKTGIDWELTGEESGKGEFVLHTIEAKTGRITSLEPV